jgi:F0F1-type ATP synthase assembly protein I
MAGSGVLGGGGIFLFGFMVCLHLQQGQRAIENIIVFVDAGAVLLIAAVKKLILVAVLAGFDNHKVTIPGLR